MGTNFVSGFSHHENNCLLEGKGKKKGNGKQSGSLSLVIIFFLKHSVHKLYEHSESFTNAFLKIEEKSLESKSVILYTDYTIHVRSIYTHLKDKVLQRFFDILSPLYLVVYHSCVYS